MADVKMSPLYFELLRQIERMSASDLALPGLSLDTSRAALVQQLGRLPRALAKRDVVGDIAYVRNGFIHGWAISLVDRGGPLNIELVQDGRVVAQALANEPIPRRLLPREVRQLSVDAGFVLRAFGTDTRAASSHLTVRVAEPETVLRSEVTVYPPSHPIRRTPFEGFVEESLDGVMTGWAWSPIDPRRNLVVVILVDGQPVGRVLANRFRGDLEAAGMAAGTYGFSFAFQPNLMDGIQRSVEVVLAENGLRLSNTPMVLRAHRLVSTRPAPWRRIRRYLGGISRLRRPRAGGAAFG